ncbi:MAG: PQQ-binding-like beta-propeller repeat protein [Verrucomicrobiota bacterium]
MREKLHHLSLILLTFSCSIHLYGDDWPQWRGMARDGVSKETISNLDWSSQKPNQLWTAEVGKGCSSMAVSDNRLYTLGNVDDKDTVYCFDAQTGEVIWKHSYPCMLSPKMYEGGPGATPVVSGDYLITLSDEGHLFCFDKASGAIKWKKHLQDDFKGQRPDWGYAGSPLVYDNKLIVDTGAPSGGVVALKLEDGSLLWKSGSGDAGYAAPVFSDFEGKASALVFRASGLTSFDWTSGSKNWHFPWKTDWDVNAATPLINGSELFLSSGYGTGSALLEVKGSSAKSIWKNNDFSNQISTSVLKDGYLYGFHTNHVSKKRDNGLSCVEWKTGKLMWKEKLGVGMTILVGEHLLALTDKNILYLVEPSPQGFKKLSELKVLDGGRSWVDPIFANGVVYCRNNEGKMAAWKL